MNRFIQIFVAVVLVGLAQPTHVAFADDPAPTKDQLDQAKAAYAEGKSLYDAGKLPEAVEKFKESYKLSRNALLLYNIGHTLDQAGDTQKALFYYRKFLADAPKEAKQRKEVDKRVADIEKANFEAELNGTTPTTGTPSGTTGGNATTTTKPVEEVKTPVKVKPAGTYSATDFQHQLIEAAPPGKPLDVTAFVPEDSGWTVTLYYRGAGDAKFIAKQMRWRYKELVARIPGSKISGTFVQYYVEAKDADGNVVTRSGKSTSPNLINVDASTPPRFYPDFTDDSEPVAMSSQEQHRQDEDEDPLHRGGSNKKPDTVETPLVTGPVEQGHGWTDVGSSKFKKAKWISTGVAGGLIAGAVVTYILAKNQASNIEGDAKRTMCDDGIAAPCPFDSYDLDVQNAGKRYNTWNTITLVGGVAAAGVAGYLWYKELKAGKRSEHSAPAPSAKGGDPDLVIVPSFGDGFAGAAAAARF